MNVSAENPQPDYFSGRDLQKSSPLSRQVAGDHYVKFAIQPVEYIAQNRIPFIEGCVIKYVSRWRDKGGIADLDKAIHFLEILKEMETRGKKVEPV